MSRYSCVTAFAAAAIATTASASVIAFDDAYKNSCDQFGGATVVASPAPRHAGDMAVRGDATGAWQQIGVNLANMVIPVDATRMQFDIYLPTVNCFGLAIVQLSGPSWQEQRFADGVNASFLTVDGKALAEGGSTATLSTGTWHTLTMDLPGAYGSTVTPGTTQLLHVVTMVNQPGTFYMDNVQLVSVPEPASIALLSLGAAALLRRRHTR